MVEQRDDRARTHADSIQFAEAYPQPDGRFDPALIFPGAEQINLKQSPLMTQMAAEQWQLQWKRESEAANALRPITLKVMGIQTASPADFANRTLDAIDERVVEQVKKLRLQNPTDEDVTRIRSDVLKEFKPKNKEDIRFEYELLKRTDQLDQALTNGKWNRAKDTILKVSEYLENPSRTQQPYIDTFLKFASERTTAEVEQRAKKNEYGQVYALFRGMHRAFDPKERIAQLHSVSQETRVKLESEAFLKIPEKNLSRTLEKQGLLLYKQEESILLEAGFTPETIRSLPKVQDTVFQKFDQQLTSALDPEYNHISRYKALQENYNKAGFSDSTFLQSERTQKKVIAALDHRLQNQQLETLRQTMESIGSIGFTDVIVTYIKAPHVQNLVHKRLQNELTSALSNDSSSVGSFARARGLLDAAGFTTEVFMQTDTVRTTIIKTLRSRAKWIGFTSFQDLISSYRAAGFQVDSSLLLSDKSIRKSLRNSLHKALYENGIPEFIKHSTQMTTLGLEQPVFAFRNNPKTQEYMKTKYRQAVLDAFSSNSKDPKAAQNTLALIESSGFFKTQITRDKAIVSAVQKRIKNNLTEGGLDDFDKASRLADTLGFGDISQEMRTNPEVTTHIRNKLNDRLKNYSVVKFIEYATRAQELGFETVIDTYRKEPKTIKYFKDKLGEQLKWMVESSEPSTNRFSTLESQYRTAGFDIVAFRQDQAIQNIILQALNTKLGYGINYYTSLTKVVTSQGFTDVLNRFSTDKKTIEQINKKLLGELEIALGGSKPEMQRYTKFRDQIEHAGFSITSFPAYEKAKVKVRALLDNKLHNYDDIGIFNAHQIAVIEAGFADVVKEYKEDKRTINYVRKLIRNKERWHSKQGAEELQKSLVKSGFTM